MRKFSPVLALAAAIALSGCPAMAPLQTPITENPAGAGAGSLLISEFSPRSGGPGTVVTIKGTGFDGKVPSNNLVMFNGAPGVVTSATETMIVATVPEGASFGTISVTVNGKVVTSADAYAAMLGIKTIMGTHLASGMPANEVSLTYDALAMDAAGNLYAAVSYWNGIVKISPDGKLTKVAGTGLSGDMGDGGPAVDARLNDPRGLAVDAAGNLYIADTYNHRVRKVSPDGTITTVAGVGASGFSGDGGPARSAQLYAPRGLALDAAGNLYIADRDNHRVRKVKPDGTITTVAGAAGWGGFSGDGGPATAARLNGPTGVTLDKDGNLYIADSNNHRIRKVSPDGTISTAAGNGNWNFSGDAGPATAAGLYNPESVAVDEDGNLYIADQYHYRIRKVTPDGTISTVAGDGNGGNRGDGGPALNAGFRANALVVGKEGSLYLSDRDSRRIRKVSSDGMITSVAGGNVPAAREGAALATEIWDPIGMAEDAQGNLYVSDQDADVVYKLTPAGQVVRVAGTGNGGSSPDGGPAREASLSGPAGLALDKSGNLYIAEQYNNKVRKVTPDGTITTVAGNGDGGNAGDNGPAIDAELDYPTGVAVDAAGNVFIADRDNHRIRKVTPDGRITTVAGTGNAGFYGDGGPATAALLNYPFGVAVDAAGNLFITDTDNARIRKVSPDGTITTVAGNGNDYHMDYYRVTGLPSQPALRATLFEPTGISLDPAGNVYFTERIGHRIRRLSPDGVLTTVAGIGVSGFAGDNGPASLARFSYPEGILVGRAGNLYVADTGNGLIRSLDY